jgi:hypothetical protein
MTRQPVKGPEICQKWSKKVTCHPKFARIAKNRSTGAKNGHAIGTMSDIVLTGADRASDWDASGE